MALVLKLITLQAFWFLAVVGGPILNDIFIYPVAIALTILNYFFYKPDISAAKYALLILFFALYGFLEGALLQYFSLGSFPEGYYPLWMNSLFVVFICYYGDALNKFQGLSKLLKFFIGGVGGALAYYSGSKFGSLIIGESSPSFFIFVFFSWGIFFVVSMDLFYKNIFSSSPPGLEQENP